MGRTPDDPKTQAAKGFPGKRRSKTEKQIAEAERVAQLLADQSAEGDPTKVPAIIADPRLKVAAQAWTEFAPKLVSYNLFDPLFRLNFAIFCVYVADFAQANEDILENGYSRLVKTISKDKMYRENPAVGRRDTAVKFILEYSKRFGLTPVDLYSIFKDQATVPAGGLFPAQAQPPKSDEPKREEDDVLGLMDRFDSPPPGVRPN